MIKIKGKHIFLAIGIIALLWFLILVISGVEGAERKATNTEENLGILSIFGIGIYAILEILDDL